MSAARYRNYSERPLGVSGWRLHTETTNDDNGQAVTTTRYIIPRQEVFCRYEINGYGNGELCAVRTSFKEGRHSVVAHVKACHPLEHAKQPKGTPGRVSTKSKNDEAGMFTEQLKLIDAYTEKATTTNKQNADRGAGYEPATPSKRAASALDNLSLGTPSKKARPEPYDANKPPEGWEDKLDKLAIPRGKGGKPLVTTMRTEIRNRRWCLKNDKGAAPCPACREAKTECPPGQYVNGSYWDTTKWADSSCYILSGYNGPEIEKGNAPA